MASRWVASASAYGTRTSSPTPRTASTNARSTATRAPSGSASNLPLPVGVADHQGVLGQGQGQPVGQDLHRRPGASSPVRRRRRGCPRRHRRSAASPRSPSRRRRRRPAVGCRRRTRSPRSPRPTSSRIRSSTWAACSTTGPPERSRRTHQSTGGTRSSQAPLTRRTVRPASSSPGLGHDVQVAPVVADGGEQPPPRHQAGDPLGGGQVHGHRLLDEHRHPGGDDRLLDRSVGERRHADVHRVRAGREQLPDVAVRPGSAVRGGQVGRGPRGRRRPRRSARRRRSRTAPGRGVGPLRRRPPAPPGTPASDRPSRTAGSSVRRPHSPGRAQSNVHPSATSRARVLIKLRGRIRLACGVLGNPSLGLPADQGVPVRNTEILVSPVVEAWATYRTSSQADWPTRRLLRAKGETPGQRGAAGAQRGGHRRGDRVDHPRAPDGPGAAGRRADRGRLAIHRPHRPGGPGGRRRGGRSGRDDPRAAPADRQGRRALGRAGRGRGRRGGVRRRRPAGVPAALRHRAARPAAHRPGRSTS